MDNHVSRVTKTRRLVTWALLAAPLLVAPLLLLALGLGNAATEEAQAACTPSLSEPGAPGVPGAPGALNLSDGSFGIGTLNWRGASHHTTNPYAGGQPSEERVPNMVAKIGASGASIVGFQEFEPPQADAFLAATAGHWAIVNGRAQGRPDTRNAIAYQPGLWRLEETRYVSITYSDSPVDIPLARLTSTTGLGTIWVLNTHNPVDAAHGSDTTRDAAVRTQATTLADLHASDPGTPVLLVGDMNDRAHFKQLFLSLAGPDWSAANPDDNQTDWIIGSPGTQFTMTVVDTTTNGNAHSYTDHPFLHTTVSLSQPPSSHGQPEEGEAGQLGTGRSGTGTDLGEMPTDVRATPGGSADGEILVANANINTRASIVPGLAALTEPIPDFITLNEVGDVPPSQLSSSAPGYQAYRDPVMVQSVDGGVRSLDNAILWRTDRWQLLDGGRVRITLEDHVIFQGHQRNWGRWAIWGVFQRIDGAVVSVIAAHQMTNPFHSPATQWGDQPFTRARQYGQGMDYLVQLTTQLSYYGPVLLGGDMNSHLNDGPNSAARKMKEAGFNYTKDSGVIYNFYPPPVYAATTWEISPETVHSDHPALFTRMLMDGATTSTSVPSGNAAPGSDPGCPPCPDGPTASNDGATSAATDDFTPNRVAATRCDTTPAAAVGQPIAELASQLTAQLGARVDAMLDAPLGLCSLSWTHGAPCTYDNQCPKVVDALYGGPGTGRGYGNGKDVAQGIIDAGLASAHGTGLDPLPPAGAVVSFNTGDSYGHVAIYVGNGQIFGNDYGCSSNGLYGCVGFADIHTPGGTVTWALPAPAFDLGGTPQPAA